MRTPSPTATVSAEIKRIRGVLTAPRCDRGWDIERIVVEVRNERDEPVASATTGKNVEGPSIHASCAVCDSPCRRQRAGLTFPFGTYAGPQFSLAELVAKHWMLQLELGDPDSTVHEGSCAPC